MANHRNLRTVERKGHHGFFIKSSYIKSLEVDKQDFEIFVVLQSINELLAALQKGQKPALNYFP